jgi:hypothetical protein
MTSRNGHGPSGGLQPRRRPVLAICGSGNAGHALAVISSRNFEGDIDWLIGSEEKADLVRRGASADGLRSTGVIEARADKLRTISSDPAEVIPDADIVLIAVPAFAHAAVLGRIAPYVNERATIGCLPARGGFEFEASVIPGTDAGGRRTIFGLQTLPWSTRVVAPGELVNVGAVKAEVVLAALPAGDGRQLADQLSSTLGTQLVPTDGFLSLTLGNPGQFIHPGLMYGHFRSWEGEEYDEESIPRLFADASDDMGRVVEDLSTEACAVARAVEAQSGGALSLGSVVPVLDWLRSSYSHVTGDMTTAATCFRTGPIQVRRAPVVETTPGRFVPNFDYRYLSEDVPFGLVITRAIAEIADVPTPVIDEVIYWAQSKMQQVYLVDGRLEGPDARPLPMPQNYGVFTLSDLLAWYDDRVTPRPRLRVSPPIP